MSEITKKDFDMMVNSFNEMNKTLKELIVHLKKNTAVHIKERIVESRKSGK